MNSINSKQEEQSSGQNSTEEASKEIYLNEEIDGGPIRIVGNTSNGYCIVFGKYRISKIYETEKEAREQAIWQRWELIINLIGAVTGQTDEIKDRIK